MLPKGGAPPFVGRRGTAKGGVDVALTIERIGGNRDLASLEEAWRDLTSKSARPNPFLSWEWVFTWWEHFGSALDLWILAAYEKSNRRLVGLAPLVVRRFPVPRRGPYSELSVLGSTVAAPDHLDAIAADSFQAEVNSAFASYIGERGRWDTFRLHGMRSDSFLIDLLLEEGGKPRGLVWESVCPFVSLPSSWEEYESSLDRKMRYNLRSRSRRLEKDADKQVSFQSVLSNPEVEDAMSELFRLHRRVRERRRTKGAFGDSLQMDFHRSIAKRFSENGWLRLYLLRVKGDAIGAVYSFRCGDIVYFYQTGYDPAWAKYGPGSAILAHSIRASIEEGAHEFDFLRGDAPYKYQWTRQARKDFRGWLSHSVRGRALIAGYRLGLNSRRVLRRMKTR
jgi:CelD/BcsL family acetyltransferase involved in cellulose biosynthesis